MTVLMTRRVDAARLNARSDQPDEHGYTSVVVLPTHSSSVALGRNIVLAWLQFATKPYHVDTTLLLVTELLRDALSGSEGALVLSVGAVAAGMHVELIQSAPTGRPTADMVGTYDDSRHLQLVSALADRWGLELLMGDTDPPRRVAWFECDPIDPVDPLASNAAER